MFEFLSRIYNYFTGNSSDFDNSSHPIFAAVKTGNLPELSRILLFRIDLEMKNQIGNTPLIEAAMNNQVNVVRLLLNHDAKLEAQGHAGFTALNASAWKGCVEPARYLIQRGANIDALSDSGTTPLISAIERQHVAMVELLITAGADTQFVTLEGWSLLEYAIQCGNRNIVNMLRGNDTAAVQTQADAAEDDDLDLPEWCIDPINFTVMIDPITLHNGQSYDRESLRKWFESKNNPAELPCPKTRMMISITELTTGTNINLRNAITEKIQQLRAEKQRQEVPVETVVSPDEELRQNRLRYFARQGMFAAGGENKNSGAAIIDRSEECRWQLLA
ncbi:MAG TPA: ankyrin repeat domain-containing protein [Gammaproteobacteria bacterium]|nr:ankyrin repeat domain-containing protein [Gammaproteobacteria bacterium]